MQEQLAHNYITPGNMRLDWTTDASTSPEITAWKNLKTRVLEAAEARRIERAAADAFAKEVCAHSSELSSDESLYEQQYSNQVATCNYPMPISGLPALYIDQCQRMARHKEVIASVPVAASNRFEIFDRRLISESDIYELRRRMSQCRATKYEGTTALRTHLSALDETGFDVFFRAAVLIYLRLNQYLVDALEEFSSSLENLARAGLDE